MCISTECPFSAIFFGIEIAGKLNTITTIWKMFVTVYIGKLLFNQLTYALLPDYPMLKYKYTHIQKSDLYQDLYLYAGLGILIGLVSVLFVKMSVRY